jgi:hypothetical protein
MVASSVASFRLSIQISFLHYVVKLVFDYKSVRFRICTEKHYNSVRNAGTTLEITVGLRHN